MTMREALHIPAANSTEDASKLGKEQEDAKGAKYWEEKEKEARAKREYEEQERAAKLAREAEHNPPEAPFAIKGEVNLGKFDFQQQQQELRNTIDRIQTETKERIEKLDASNAHYRDEVNKLQVQMVESTLKAQIESLQKTIMQNNAPGGNASIIDRFNEITQIAGMLGFTRPDTGAVQEQMPANIQLQMLKMEMEEKGRQRQFEWDKIESERNWQIAIKKLELEADAKKQEIALEREKRASFISPFESIGAAIARGFADMGTNAISEPGSKVKKKAVKKKFQMQAGENDSGTIECPQCQEAIAIAPKAKSAFCPSCEATVAIERIPDEVPQTVKEAGLV